ncbi:MAG: hypothetical protein WC102_06835 [Saccharofermentanales bacterium]|jgi:hypothetical protein
MRCNGWLHLPFGNGAVDKMAPEWEPVRKAVKNMRKLKYEEMQVILIIILCGMVVRACS